MVSDNTWTAQDTNAVCRQLGRNRNACRSAVCIQESLSLYNNAGIGTESSYYNYNDDLPVVVSDVQCAGTESRLIDCPYTSGGNGSLVSLWCSSMSRFNDKLLDNYFQFEILYSVKHSKSAYQLRRFQVSSVFQIIPEVKANF